MEIYKKFFTDFRKDWKNYEEFDECTTEEKSRIVKVIEDFRIINDKVSLNDFEEYLKIAKQVSRNWVSKMKKLSKTNLDKYFSEYSIGHLVEIEPK